MQFSDDDTQRIKSFYQELLKQNGQNDPKSLNWNSKYTQDIRFLTLSQISKLEDATTPDVGCGLGDLYEYLARTLKVFEYVGIDIVPEMISEARKRFPNVDFRIHDFSKDMNGKFDYVLSSGTLSYKIDNYKDIYLRMIKRMYDLCNKGTAFNVLDKRKHPDDEIYVSYTPIEIYEYCSGLTDKLVLRHDYLDYDFTLYLYR